MNDTRMPAHGYSPSWTEFRHNRYLSDSIGKLPGIVWKLAACEQAHLPILKAHPGLRAIAALQEIRRRHPEISPASLPKTSSGNYSAHLARPRAPDCPVAGSATTDLILIAFLRGKPRLVGFSSARKAGAG
jgi:hypothetical protein